jgi:hypothetical protein
VKRTDCRWISAEIGSLKDCPLVGEPELVLEVLKLGVIHGAENGLINLETGMERDEDGVVLGSTRLPGSQRLHR